MSSSSSPGPDRGGRNTLSKPDASRGSWLRWILVLLVIEKIIQHIVVTAAFFFDWKDIASTVAVDPTLLMILGALVALLFVVALWALLGRRSWATGLVIGLGLFDILGEFVAQGTLIITITVSFLVAIMLLILALLYRRWAAPVPRPSFPLGR